jgi:NADH:ubiquinone oxidoreductase subunit K
MISLWWLAITLMILGVIGALFRRQILMISLNIDMALIGAALGLMHSSQTWENNIGFYLSILILGLVMLHQLIMFALAYFLYHKFGTLHLDELRNLRG